MAPAETVNVVPLLTASDCATMGALVLGTLLNVLSVTSSAAVGTRPQLHAVGVCHGKPLAPVHTQMSARATDAEKARSVRRRRRMIGWKELRYQEIGRRQQNVPHPIVRPVRADYPSRAHHAS